MAEGALLLDDARRSGQFRRSSTRLLNTSIQGDAGYDLYTAEATEAQSNRSRPREARIQISKWQFFMQIVRISVGTGVITLPSTVAKAGTILGMVGILVVSIIAINSAHLLVESVHLLRKRYGLESVDLNYKKTVEYSFAYGPVWGRRLRWTSKLLNVCLGINHFCICLLYILFVSRNIKYLVADYFELPLYVYVIIVTLIIAPLTFIRSIRLLSNISAFSNFFMLIALGLILSYCCQDIPDVTQYPYITNMVEIPLFFGVTMFSLGAIDILLPHENALDDKESLRGWGGLLNLTFGTVMVINLLIAFFGYAKFGSDVKVSLTDSIPMTAWYLTLVKPLYAFLIVINFGILFFFFVDIIWQPLRIRITESIWLRHACAMTSLAVMCSCAAAIPHVSDVISLVAYVTGALLWLVIPALVHTLTFWDHQPNTMKFQLMLVKNSMVIGFGLFGAAIGTYVSILALLQDFKGEKESSIIPEP